jgi:lipoprotein-releasing system ATP-binding protein
MNLLLFFTGNGYIGSMACAGPLLQLLNVTKRFESPENDRSLTILDGVCLEIQPLERLAIMGPSGSGKSTLLHLMGGLDQPTSGKILLNGDHLGSLDEPGLAAMRNQGIGFVFQAHYLLPQCTVLENVVVPTLARERQTQADRQSAERRARDLLSNLGLGERLAHRPGQLSGGERQRVAVARALINRPALLLADEPTGALDQSSATQLAETLANLNRREQVTIVMVTHSPVLAATADRVLGLRNGHLSPLDVSSAFPASS